MSDTIDSFLSRLKSQKENSTYSQLVRKYGINRWHIWQFLNNPEYNPSAAVRRKLGIIKRKTPSRAIVYFGTDKEKARRDLEAVTGTRWMYFEGGEWVGEF